MAASATLSSKFQISLPKAVREAQHWQAGQEFVFIPKGKGVLLMPVPNWRIWQALPKVPTPTPCVTVRIVIDGGNALCG